MSTTELFKKHFGDTSSVDMKHPNIENFFNELNQECLNEDNHLNPVTHKIVQWGEVKFKGTLEQCKKLKKEWTEKAGNIELDILPIKFPTNQF